MHHLTVNSVRSLFPTGSVVGMDQLKVNTMGLGSEAQIFISLIVKGFNQLDIVYSVHREKMLLLVRFFYFVVFFHNFRIDDGFHAA